MKVHIHRSDLIGGLLAGLVTGLGVGLLLSPGRGRAAGALGKSDWAQRIAASGPLIFEAGLMLLAQTRPTLGRLAWSIVHLAGRGRSGTPQA